MAADQADVRSVEQLDHFLEHTKRYRTQLLKELENLEVEIRRLSNWIQREAPNYWNEELRRARHAYTEAQEALSRCMSYVREDERRPCTEQKKRVRVTKDRRDLCEERLRTARGAAGAWEREIHKNQGKFQRVRDMADADLLVAVGQLTQQLETLVEYAGLRSAGLKSLTSSSGQDAAASSANSDVSQSENGGSDASNES